MESKDVEEIIACLPQGRSLFHYFKDYYALQLLGWAVGDGTTLERLRRGRFGPLLNKPLVRPLLARCGDGRLTTERVAGQWCEPSLPFLMTLGRWRGGGWNQTSRPGWNLVLRLNFPLSHDRCFRKSLAKHYGCDDLNFGGHPVLRQGERSYYRHTLAWARLDLDLERGEALIEEIQNDWVREARDESRALDRCRRCTNPGRYPGCRARLASIDYLDRVLAPYAALWDQAMLSATLFFLVEELGIRDIWYHHWETGNALKGLSGRWLPPRSLYTKLPRRFCFNLTDGIPQLLKTRSTRRRLHKARIEPRFHRLQL